MAGVLIPAGPTLPRANDSLLAPEDHGSAQHRGVHLYITYNTYQSLHGSPSIRTLFMACLQY